MRYILYNFILICTLCSSVYAQLDGARTYWPLPKNTNIIAGHMIFGTANATWSNWELLQPDIDIKSELYLFTYTRHQPIFGRTTAWTLAIPAGQIETGSSLPVNATDPFVHGFGDISLGVAINLFGAPGLTAKEFVRYDQKTNFGLGFTTTFPTGQYNKNESLNMGSNQFKFRFSLPIVHAIGPWVPGKRMTLELLPSATVFTENDDAFGATVEQEPVLMVESHLTRDLTKKSFLSIDYSFIKVGDATITDNTTSETSEQNDKTFQLLGATLNFIINDNMQLFLTHMQTFDEKGTPVPFEGSLFKATLSWSWHGVLQRVTDFHE